MNHFRMQLKWKIEINKQINEKKMNKIQYMSCEFMIKAWKNEEIDKVVGWLSQWMPF